MSAWIVSEKHVLTLAYFYHKFYFNSIDTWEDTPEFYHPIIKSTARILWNENIKSVDYRYDEKNPRRSFTKNVLPETDLSYEGVVKVIDCWVYQSCEHPGFYRSKAYRMMLELKSHILDYAIKNSITFDRENYENTGWGI